MGGQRLDALRQVLAGQGADAFLLPRSDEYLNEDLAPADERLRWVSGFTGSQGLLAVVADGAALLVDGRYSLQAQRECAAWLEVLALDDDELFAWLEHRLPAAATLVADARLHSVAQWRRWQRLAAERGWRLVACRDNPLDACWLGRPVAAASRVVAQPLQWAGEPAASKLQRLAVQLREQACDALWLPAPDMLAWLLNLRGQDIAIAPLPFSSGLLYADGALDWFIDAARLDLPPGWLPERVRVLPPAQARRPDAPLRERGCERVWVDEESCNAFSFEALRASGCELRLASHPLPLLRACKNAAELAGSREAHRRDGLVLCRFLHAFETRAEDFRAADELDVAAILEGYRCRDADYRGVSFDTIAACGANAAQPHYLPKAGAAAALNQGELLLIDSGGQYPQGTTDVTRVLAVGPAGPRQRELYTRVLRAHIALAGCRFPVGTSGRQLDVVARQVLWQAGQDYAHGTGHGVGSYLQVHEGPQRIAAQASPVALRPGMLTSIEPGLYLDGELGIRLENLYEVIECPLFPGFLAFRALTLAPFEPALIDFEQLSRAEREWLRDYHREVCERLAPDLEPALAAWLRAKTGAAAESAAWA
ncbi:aminopeptidase P family protein [Pseudomonas citronellolis]|uniref:aminopeptidase P family protein n=1 Tax=Pseudomonas citronellolis TaxID=53408 RepID=UPI0023E3FC72|nr:aminopeptidase P family protein [Pseudomonas citronellolis]MDF3935714.1 aminopeptidase P family protein [Pseudomonas citronellolis]